MRDNPYSSTNQSIVAVLRGYIIMPVVSEFYGIKISFYYDDHNPPHFHADYNSQKILVDIVKGRVSF